MSSKLAWELPVVAVKGYGHIFGVQMQNSSTQTLTPEVTFDAQNYQKMVVTFDLNNQNFLTGDNTSLLPECNNIRLDFLLASIHQK